MSSIAPWPVKMTREQQRMAKERNKHFNASLKRLARAAGWRFADGSLFRQSGDWFVSTQPWLLWERGAVTRLSIKPMAIDPLFWSIVGLSENEALPLSFRERGAWVLRTPATEVEIGLDCADVDALAAETLRVVTRQADSAVDASSLQSVLAQLPAEEELRGQPRACAVCLHILLGDFEGALRLCQPAEPTAHPLMQDGGGFITQVSDGSSMTFLQQARDWIVARRRETFRVVA